MAQQHLQRRYARLIHARLGLVQHAPSGLLRDMGALFVQGVQALEQHVLRAHADDAAVVAHRRHGLGPLQRVQQGQLTLHGWHYVIEEGQVYVFDVASGGFIAASQAAHSGTMPYPPYVEHDGQVLADF